MTPILSQGKSIHFLQKKWDLGCMEFLSHSEKCLGKIVFLSYSEKCLGEIAFFPYFQMPSIVSPTMVTENICE